MSIGACQPGRKGQTASQRSSGKAGHAFTLAASAELLAKTSADFSRGGDLRRVFSAGAGSRFLLLPRGTSHSALFVDLAAHPAPEKSLLTGKLLCADCAAAKAWCIEAGSERLVALDLANPASPPLALPALPAGQRVIAADIDPGAGSLYVLTAEASAEAAPEAAAVPETAAAPEPTNAAGAGNAVRLPASGDPAAEAPAAPENTSASADASGETHSASPPVLGGPAGHLYKLAEGAFSEVLATKLGPVAPAADQQLAALPGGGAALYLPAGQLLWLLGADPAKDKSLTQIGELGSALLSADVAQPVAWLYARPQDASSGSERAARSAKPGEILAFGPGGKQLARYKTGSVPFNQLSGDSKNLRCLLGLSSAGVALVSIDKAQASPSASPGALDAGMRWLLRHGGDAPLFLAGGQLWAGLPGGVYRIPADELIKQAPQLAAAQTLPREQVRPLRKACAALGWDWGTVQVSPLAGFEGRLVLFDSAGRDASTAELQWDAKGLRATHVLVARLPGEADSALLKAPAADIEAACTGMLSALGWPGAQLDSSGVVQDEYSAAASYSLDAAQPESGSFSLWVTDSVALITLEAQCNELLQD